jgi:hypothetical protein
VQPGRPSRVVPLVRAGPGSQVRQVGHRPHNTTGWLRRASRAQPLRSTHRDCLRARKSPRRYRDRCGPSRSVSQRLGSRGFRSILHGSRGVIAASRSTARRSTARRSGAAVATGVAASAVVAAAVVPTAAATGVAAGRSTAGRLTALLRGAAARGRTARLTARGAAVAAATAAATASVSRVGHEGHQGRDHHQTKNLTRHVASPC